MRRFQLKTYRPRPDVFLLTFCECSRKKQQSGGKSLFHLDHPQKKYRLSPEETMRIPESSSLVHHFRSLPFSFLFISEAERKAKETQSAGRSLTKRQLATVERRESRNVQSEQVRKNEWDGKKNGRERNIDDAGTMREARESAWGIYEFSRLNSQELFPA